MGAPRTAERAERKSTAIEVKEIMNRSFKGGREKLSRDDKGERKEEGFRWMGGGGEGFV